MRLGWGYRALVFIMLVLLAALYWAIIHQRGLRFVRPLCVAREFQWCDHVYPRWAGHALCHGHGQLKCPVLVSPASLIGSERSVYLAPALRFFAPAPISPAATKTTRAGVSFGVPRPTTTERSEMGEETQFWGVAVDRYDQGGRPTNALLEYSGITPESK